MLGNKKAGQESVTATQRLWFKLRSNSVIKAGNCRHETQLTTKLGLIVAHNTNPLHGRDGRVSTGRGAGNPCRSRAVVKVAKWLTERARHPWHGYRRTVGTATGRSPTSTNTIPPYLPLPPSASSSEEGEGEMDQANMTRRERDRRLKLGRGDDDKGGKGHRKIGCTSNPLLEIRAALEAAAFLQSVVPRPLDPAPPEDEHPAATIRPCSRQHRLSASGAHQRLGLERYASDAACVLTPAVLPPLPFDASTVSPLCIWSYARSLSLFPPRSYCSSLCIRLAGGAASAALSVERLASVSYLRSSLPLRYAAGSRILRSSASSCIPRYSAVLCEFFIPRDDDSSDNLKDKDFSGNECPQEVVPEGSNLDPSFARGDFDPLDAGELELSGSWRTIMGVQGTECTLSA
ncbi:hypothetical protein DFH09DRAFT_1077878 [Mycena vulgaris]|nr:hypothetical protein DFH09DRAFT_1077878 [Mycena vulgaris]